MTTRARWLTAFMAAAGAVLLAACGSTDEATAPTEAHPTTTTTVSSPTPTGAGTAGGPCAAASLRVTLGRGSGAAGHFYVPVVFTNGSSTPCTISGYPDVAYVSAAGGAAVGDPAEHTSGQSTPVRLAMGGVASALLNEVDVGAIPRATCGPTSVAGLRVGAPGGGSSVFVAQPNARACTKHMPGQPQLRIGPVVPGSSGR